MCSIPSPRNIISPSVRFDATVTRVAKINSIISKCMEISHITADNITIVDPPTNPTDAATKEYVDSKNIFVWKSPVVVATTGQQTLFGVPIDIDGYPALAGQRVLVHKQLNAIENGIYTVDSGSWPRATDLPIGADASGVAMWVLEGTIYIHTTFVCDNLPESDIVGTDELNFVQFSGGTGMIDPGDALTLTGNVLDVNINNTSIGINGSNELELKNTTVVPASYGSSTQIPTFTVDQTGRLTAAANVSFGTSLISGNFRIISPTTIISLPYSLTANEFMGSYIIIDIGTTGVVNLPSITSIISEIGVGNYITNMSMTFSILKVGSNHVHIVLGTGMSNPYSVSLLINSDHVSNYILVLTSTTTGIILPLGNDHSI